MRNPTATEIVLASDAKERGDSLDRGILPNSQSTPEYSYSDLLLFYVATLIAFFMGFGVAWAVFHGK